MALLDIIFQQQNFPIFISNAYIYIIFDVIISILIQRTSFFDGLTKNIDVNIRISQFKCITLERESK